MEKLRSHIKSQVDIDDAALETILSNFKELKVSKERFALKPGQLVTDYYFIDAGAIRVFFNQNDKQITSWVALENEFFTDLSSVKKRTPSIFCFQAIEDTILLTIKSDKMEQLYRQFPLWQEFGRLIWETNFQNLLKGVISFQTKTAEERYLETMKDTDLIKRVPLKFLASYLGITPSSLSRLRKTIK